MLRPFRSQSWESAGKVFLKKNGLILSLELILYLDSINQVSFAINSYEAKELCQFNSMQAYK